MIDNQVLDEKMSQMQRAGNKRLRGDKAIFSVILGCVGFTADVLGVYQFIDSKGFKDFWSFHWIISILIIASVSAALIVLVVNILNGTLIEKIVLIIFGASYAIFSALIYASWGELQINGHLGLGDFTGFFALFFIALVIACSSMLLLDEGVDKLRFISYAIAAANIYVLYFMIHKYITDHAKFDLPVFSGEASIMIIGPALFLALFSGDKQVLSSVFSWHLIFLFVIVLAFFNIFYWVLGGGLGLALALGIYFSYKDKDKDKDKEPSSSLEP